MTGTPLPDERKSYPSWAFVLLALLVFAAAGFVTIRPGLWSFAVVIAVVAVGRALSSRWSVPPAVLRFLGSANQRIPATWSRRRPPSE